MHQVAQLGVGGLLCGADRAAAGVVDQDVDATVSVEHLADGGGDAVGVCDVELQRGDPVGVGLDEIGHRVGPARACAVAISASSNDAAMNQSARRGLYRHVHYPT